MDSDDESHDTVFDYYQEIARSAFADMLHDTERNRKYSLALKEAIVETKKLGKKANVLDIGTGTGLLAMLAAQHGADSVVTVEAFGPVSEIAQKIIEANGFGNKIKIIRKHSRAVYIGADMEHKANILVAEVLDTELIGEGAISTYNDVHESLMEKECICVPHCASIYAQIVESSMASTWNRPKMIPSLDGEMLVGTPRVVNSCTGQPSIQDVQLSQFKSFTSIADPIKVCEIDFSGKTVIPKKDQFVKEFQSKHTGVAHVVFFWWDLNMNPSGSIVLSCAPHWSHPDTAELMKTSNNQPQNVIPWRDHWMQGIYHLRSELIINEGESAFMVANHDEFSWWFNLDRKIPTETEVSMPGCNCIYHAINSRNRIMQSGETSRAKQFLKYFEDNIEPKTQILFISDHSLIALAIGASCKVSDTLQVHVWDQHLLSYKSMKNFIISNQIQDKVNLINKLEELPSTEITNVVGEPYFHTATLPWENISMFMEKLKEFKKIQYNLPFHITPMKALIYAVPVKFLNLHKIQWPLKLSCEGFDHQIFDEFVQSASDMTDRNVEAFSLWEYPCVALGSPVCIADVDFGIGLTKSFNKITTNLKVTSNTDKCNGLALYVNWQLNDRLTISSGPEEAITINSLIKWKIHERQAVHLIPERFAEKSPITDISIGVSFNETNEISMDFSYFYVSKQS
ncbi:unnamed protein product [Diamesa tonsa]